MTDSGSSQPRSSNELAQDRTDLADARTRLAVTRTRVAHDRTLMAWIRTAVSLISFGFTIYKFFQALDQSGRTNRLMSPRDVGMIMITLGVGGLIMATLDHRHELAELRKEFPGVVPGKRSVSQSLATVIAGLGILGLVMVFFRQ
jgi:inner membrane protein YidH